MMKLGTPLLPLFRKLFQPFYPPFDLSFKSGDGGMVSPHVLGHFFATTMISNGCDLLHLSNIPGHSNLMTTAEWSGSKPK
jgi:integrase